MTWEKFSKVHQWPVSLPTHHPYKCYYLGHHCHPAVCTTILTVVDSFSLAMYPLQTPPQQRLVNYWSNMYSAFTVSQGTSFPIKAPSSSPLGMEGFLQCAMVSLAFRYHHQSNSKTETAKESLERALWCVSAWLPTSWSLFLPEVEYAHNSQPG